MAGFTEVNGVQHMLIQDFFSLLFPVFMEVIWIL